MRFAFPPYAPFEVRPMAEVLHRQAQHDATVAEPRPQGVAPRAAGPRGDEGLHKIVVVGGGAAGLELVTRLGDRLGRRRQANVTLVESARTHLWKPLLHEVAAGSMDPGEYERNYLAQAHWHGFRYRLGEMIGLDRAAKEVHLAATFDDEGRQITPPRSVGYDTLVIAIGSVTNDFGTPGVTEHAVPLETPAQAARFNRRLVNACIRAETQEGPVRPGQLHVAIVGAGATGAELAAELHRTTREVVAYGLDRIDPERDIRIVLIEGADRILPGLPERISEAARRLLDRIGIEVHTGAKVTAVTADGLRLADGTFIASELVVWAAGVKAPEVLGHLDGLEVNRINQLVVEPTLQTTGDPDIFAIGDCAACPRQGEPTPVPPRAQAAHQEAAHMVRQINRRLHGEPLLPYTYRDFGSLVSLGQHSTVGNLMGLLFGRGFFIEGLVAGVMYRSLRMLHERALHGTRRAVLGLLARGLSPRTGPPVKLH
jgi:NADH:ubiquinone reductase (H+-translocating)